MLYVPGFLKELEDLEGGGGSQSEVLRGVNGLLDQIEGFFSGGDERPIDLDYPFYGFDDQLLGGDVVHPGSFRPGFGNMFDNGFAIYDEQANNPKNGS